MERLSDKVIKTSKSAIENKLSIISRLLAKEKAKEEPDELIIEDLTFRIKSFTGKIGKINKLINRE
tara:strand:- start:4165 stop:4362 length:198 start_codon:yes stop_codon:yes gene_type:complete